MAAYTIAQLGMQINSESAVTAADNLDRMVNAGIRTNQELTILNLKQQQSTKSMADMAQTTAKVAQELQSLNLKQSYSAQAMNDLVRSSGLAVDELRQLNSQQQASAQQMDSLRSAVLSSAGAFQAATASLQAFITQSQQVAAASTQAGEGVKREKDELSKLLGQIDPTVAALGRLDEMERKLQGYRKQGLIDADTFTDYKTKLDQTREGLGRLNDTMGKSAISAKQTAAALRGVPAQFTDIVTSLQGGQAPLTVLLQQGGQLKDMFGGIGPAARALGGYVAGLVNPFTIAAAAVGVLSLAYYKGADEAQEYQKALILSGNAAGTSAEQLSAMARQVSGTVGTTGAAAEVLTQLAASGKVAAGSFELITKAAFEMEEASGKAAEETVAEFVKIGKDPVAAAKELNEQYSFLTQSVYEQIVALKEQGNNVGAVKLLTDTYADTVRTRANEITNNLGLVERAWLGIKNAAKRAFDDVADVGRAKTLEEQRADLEKQLAGSPSGLSGRTSIRAQFDDSRAPSGSSKADLQAQLDFVNTQIEAEKIRTKYVGERVQAEKEAVDATGRLKSLNDENLTAEQKRNKLTKEYLRDVEAIRAVNPNSALVTPDAVAKGLQNIKDKNKDPKSASTPLNLSAFNDQQNALKALVSDYSNSQKQLDAEQKAGIVSAEQYYTQRTALIRAEKEQVTTAYQAEIEALEQTKSRSTTTAEQRIQLDQKIADARASMVKAQKNADSELEVLASQEQGRLRKQTQAVQTYTDALQQQVATLRQQGDRAAATLGMGDRQRSLYESQNGIDDRINQQKVELANQYGDGSRGMSLDEYQQKLSALNKTQQDLSDTVQANYDKMTEAQGNWAAGASSAFQNYLESARDVAGQTKGLFTDAFQGMEDAVVTFATTGKWSFADFAKSIIADMARIAARQAESGLLSLAASAVTSYFAGGSTAGATAGSSASDYTGSAFSSWAAGQRAVGGPVSAGSMYQVNEKGPELLNQGGKSYLMMGGQGGSITPLGTTAGLTSAASGGVNVVVNAPVTVENKDQGAGQIDQQTLQRSMQQQMQAVAEKAVADSWRAGGTSYRQVRSS